MPAAGQPFIVSRTCVLSPMEKFFQVVEIVIVHKSVYIFSGLVYHFPKLKAHALKTHTPTLIPP